MVEWHKDYDYYSDSSMDDSLAVTKEEECCTENLKSHS